MKTTIIFHIFTDGYDQWCDSQEEAFRVTKILTDNGEKNLRIYREVYVNGEDDCIEEDCIYSVGDFPY